MAFQDSRPRVAGQDFLYMDMAFSSEISHSFQGVRSSPIPCKQMYRDNESIQSWINGVHYPSKSVFNPEDPGDTNVFKFASHPFRACLPHSPFSDEDDSDSEVSFSSDSWAWAPAILEPSYVDSGEIRSESSISDDAQYFTIPSDSPWYRPPPSPSPGPVSAHEFNTALYAKSCSSDVRQAIAQQELLLAIFHRELRRVMPRDDTSDYDSDWLEDMDADLVLAPLETYADLCWESAISGEQPPVLRSDRPIPDVPMGFDDV